MLNNYFKEFTGEFLGTFILVFFGCSSVAVSVLFNALGLFEVAIIWGGGVMLGIFASSNLSPSHLNPAVSLAMLLDKKSSLRQSMIYIMAQLTGAFVAASFVYLIYHPAISEYELAHQIVRGEKASVKTAMIFGEFYPNPAFTQFLSVTNFQAFLAETAGTFFLVLMIFVLANTMEHKFLKPILIGFTVSIIIMVIAPLTQAGLNPARDFAPRIFAYWMGWGNAAFPDPGYGYLIIYVVGPLAGSSMAVFLYNKILKSFRKP